MKISDKKLIGLPKDHYLLFLGVTRNSGLYFTVIISEKKWCSHQLKNIRKGEIINDMGGLLDGAKIAVGENEQELVFQAVDIFSINNTHQTNWLLVANKGKITLTKSDEVVYLEGEELTSIETIHSAFK